MASSEYIRVDIVAVGGPGSPDQARFGVFPQEFGNWVLVGFERQP